jgi:PKD repeat protein
MFGSTGSASYTFVSDTEITAPAPAEAAGTVNILVTTDGGTSVSSTSDQFSYTEAADVPVPGFSGTPTSGISPLTVQFTDASTGSPTTWNWTFGDGNTSTLEDPSYTYVNDGTYDVSLTETNDFGSNTTTQTGSIVVGSTGVPAADFSAGTTSGTAPLVVSFTDMSTGSPTTWAWDFGDGTTGSDENPIHTYTTAGTYSVSLIATNAAGSNTAVKSDYITVSGDTGATVTQEETPVQSDIPSATPVPGYTYVLPSATHQASVSGSSSGGKSTAGSDAWVNEENQKMAAIDAEAPAAPQQTDIISSVVSFFESLFSWI